MGWWCVRWQSDGFVVVTRRAFTWLSIVLKDIWLVDVLGSNDIDGSSASLIQTDYGSLHLWWDIGVRHLGSGLVESWRLQFLFISGHQDWSNLNKVRRWIWIKLGRAPWGGVARTKRPWEGCMIDLMIHKFFAILIDLGMENLGELLEKLH